MAAGSWQEQNSGVYDRLLSVAYGNGVFVAGSDSGNIVTSTDGGGSWQKKANAGSPIWDIVYGKQWVSVGDQGTIFTSSNGTDWIPRTSGVSTNLYSIAYNGDMYVAVGQMGSLVTSQDGISWIRQSIPLVDLEAVTYGSGQFVAVGVNGIVYTSPDGIAWTGGTSKTSDWLSGISYGAGQYVAVSVDGNVYTSPTGTTWTLRPTPLQGTPLVGVEYGGGNFVAVGENGKIITSTDGNTWSDESTNAGTSLYAVTYGGGKFVVVGQNGGAGVILTKTILSSNAQLSNLTLSSAVLTPAFSSGTTSYTASVANSVNSIGITPTVADSTATVKVNGTSVASGTSSTIPLNVGSNTITVVVTAQDGTTKQTYTTTVTRAAASTNANLSNLTLSAGTLSPTFASGTTSYSANVAYSMSSIGVTPTVADSTATVKVNEAIVPSGTAKTVNLDVGANTIKVEVTAQDGTTTQTYIITVTRAAPSANADLSNLTLSAGTLSPTFASGTTSYTASVAYSMSSIGITPTVADSTATVKVNGASVPSGTAKTVNLDVGANTITVEVAAQDGTTTQTYTITVTRAAASTNADLSNLTLSAGTLSPTFASGTTNYTSNVAYSVSSVDITPTVTDSTATVTVNGNSVTSGTVSSISLNVGDNPITVVVTAQDGMTTQTYTITVTRAAPSANADLSSLILSKGTLSPAFASGTTSYTSSVAYSVSRVDITHTVADSTATVTVNGSSVASGTASSISLNVGANTVTVVVTAQDGSTKTYTITVTRAAASANADLSNLTLSTGTLSPTFASGTTTYLATVAYGVNSVDITPTIADSTATVTVNGNSVTSGTASSISLGVGVTTITIVVTAQDGSTKTYTIMGVHAAPSTNADLSNLTLNEGTLSPTFASGTTSYTSSVAYSVISVDITPTVADNTATVTVNGNSVTSGTASSISLNVGANTITVVVRAQDGSTKTYTITVTRAAASANADLSSLTLSAGTLSPTFASGTTSYTSSVTYSVSSVDITPTITDSTATVTVNGNSVTSGTASSISLNVGDNPITVVVTAQNGSTQTYTITVTRAALSANAGLSSLTLSAGTLSPGFASGTTSYTSSVAYSVSSMGVTPTAAGSEATVAVNGNSVASGTSKTVNLNVGANVITILVTAEDGTTNTYTISVTRAGAPLPPTLPTPPVDNRTEPEKQIDRNEEAAEAIGEAKNKQAVLHIMDESFDQLKRLEKLDKITTADKLSVLQNAVTTLFEASVEKMNDGVISDKDVAKYVEQLLEEHIASVVEDVPVDDHELNDLATSLLATVVDTVLSHLDEKRVEGKLADRFGNILTGMLNRVNQVEIDKSDTVSDLTEPIERVNKTLTTIFGNWDSGRKLIAVKKQIVFSMTREQSGIHLLEDAVDQLAEERFSLQLISASQAGMEVPAALLDTLKNKDLELSMEQAVEPPHALTYTNSSPMYSFTMRANGKEITKFGKHSVRVTFPYDSKARSVQAYYYDEKQKSWKLLTDSRGKAIEVERDGSLILFDTPHFTQFMVAEAPVRSLSAKQSNLKLGAGQSTQLQVTAYLASGTKADVTKADKGTTYESSNPDLLSVSEEGMLTAAKDTGTGATESATVTIRNGDKTAKVKVSILRIRSLSVTAKKQAVAQGTILPITINVTFSDRSKLNVTKAAETHYSLEDDTYANIDASGVLTVHEDAPAGTVIKVKAEYQNVEQVYEVTVK